MDEHVIQQKTPETAKNPEAVHSSEPVSAEQSQNKDVPKPSEDLVEEIKFEVERMIPTDLVRTQFDVKKRII